MASTQKLVALLSNPLDLLLNSALLLAAFHWPDGIGKGFARGVNTSRSFQGLNKNCSKPMPNKPFSTRIKDAGIAIRHSRGGILFYTAGSRNGLERVAGQAPGHKKEVVPKKNIFFCYRKIY